MKNKLLPFIIIILLTIVACKKNSLPEGGFRGTWRAKDKPEMLFFMNDSIFNQFHGGLGSIGIPYTYSFTQDSITIQYAGPEYVLRRSTHHYTLTDSKLIIDGFGAVEYIRSAELTNF